MGQKVQGTKMVETVGGRSVLCLANKQLEDEINKAIKELSKENKTVINVTHNGIRRAMGGVLWVASATILWECEADTTSQLQEKTRSPEEIAKEIIISNEQISKLDAVVSLRQQTGLGLPECKDIIDKILEDTGNR